MLEPAVEENRTEKGYSSRVFSETEIVRVYLCSTLRYPNVCGNLYFNERNG